MNVAKWLLLAILALPVAELDVLLDAFAAKPTAVLELVTTSAPWFGPLPLALARLPREVLTLLSPEAVAAVPKAEFAELLPVATLMSPTAALLDAPVPVAFAACPQARFPGPAVAPCPVPEATSLQTNCAWAGRKSIDPAAMAMARPQIERLVRLFLIGAGNLVELPLGCKAAGLHRSPRNTRSPTARTVVATPSNKIILTSIRCRTVAGGRYPNCFS